ncbi:SDR family oxidoreductase [Aspergillus homomorphus CBS 101889]|uniref:NAD(P)-binding protein n=1 Tax=Aspergillus homomorphus (strain CBS 101889) TaxID=1450537 RepID=A0A395I2N7_ASPHC|nr:NAD(P)-binding protein [Aspergillus homomorphus CBS 101889]RAL13933.1 NAD(P)-binding protein [Aspergillus homomorphus CBS 101889]
MSSYLITGASRGLGWEFVRQLSSDPKNTVIGLVRDKPATEKRVTQELESRPNIHILQADITDYSALQAAVEQTATITDGALDYLIANAGYVSKFDAYDAIGVLGQQPEALEEDLLRAVRVNVAGNIHLFNLFLPLILKGQAKKVVAISTGMADADFVAKFKIEVGSLYSISKAALNTAVAKFSAQYAKDGVLFFSISPGLVDTGNLGGATPEQMSGLARMLEGFKEYAAHFTGPITPEVSVEHVLSVIYKASVENGDGGSFVSHFGNKQWL